MKAKKKYKIIDEYLAANYPNKQTYTNNKWIFYEFFEVLGVDPDVYFAQGLTKKEYEADIEAKIPQFSGSICSYFSTIAKFYRKQIDIEIRKRVKELISDSKKRKVQKHKEVPMERKDLKIILGTIYPPSTDEELHTLAACLFLVSSGMRQSELCKLEEKDIGWNYEKRLDGYIPIHIRKEVAKTRIARTTFITLEAKKWFKKYLEEVRPQLIAKRSTHDKKSLYYLDPETKNVFLFNEKTFRIRWKKLLEEAGSPYNKKSTIKVISKFSKERIETRYLYRFYGSRSFFKSEPPEVSDAMNIFCGHSGKVIRCEYLRKSIIKWMPEYKKLVHFLTIFQDLQPIIILSPEQEYIKEIVEKLDSKMDIIIDILRHKE